MRLSASEVKRRVVRVIEEKYRDEVPTHISLLEMIFDLIEERDKYRDHRA